MLPRMVIALIAIGVIAFLAIDAYVILRAFRSSARPQATETRSTSACPASFRSPWSRALVGTVQVTEPGSYTVKAEQAIEGGVEPKILLGK